MSSALQQNCPWEPKSSWFCSGCSPAAGRKMLFTFVVQLRLISSPGLRANSCRHMWVVLIVSKAEAGVNAHIRYGPVLQKQMEACTKGRRSDGKVIWLLLADIFAEFTVSVFWKPQAMKGSHLRMDIGSKQHLNIGCRLQNKKTQTKRKRKHFSPVQNITCAQHGIVNCFYCIVLGTGLTGEMGAWSDLGSRRGWRSLIMLAWERERNIIRLECSCISMTLTKWERKNLNL